VLAFALVFTCVFVLMLSLVLVIAFPLVFELMLIFGVGVVLLLLFVFVIFFVFALGFTLIFVFALALLLIAVLCRCLFQCGMFYCSIVGIVVEVVIFWFCLWCCVDVGVCAVVGIGCCFYVVVYVDVSCCVGVMLPFALLLSLCHVSGLRLECVVVIASVFACVVDTVVVCCV